MKTSYLSLILAFHFSFFVTVIQRQVYPPIDLEEEASDTINEEWTPERKVIELIKEKDCYTPLNVRNSIDYIDFRDKFGGYPEIIKMLLAKGANIESRTRRGATPLFVSSQEGHTEIVKLLLEHGADINMRTGDGLNPLLIASLRGHSEIASILLENNAKVDSQTNDGTSALMIAAANGHTPIVRLLLEKGANVFLKNRYDKSAVDVAASEEIRKLLTDSVQKH